MVLDKRSCDLLRYLMDLDEPETVMAISRATQQSRRKIYYHLEKINDALPQEMEKIISIPRVGLLLTKSQKEVCRELLGDLNDYSYVMSMTERVMLSLLYIATAPIRVTIEKLMQLNGVSRNTILNDLHAIRNELDRTGYALQLQVTKSSGYYLECHPLVKIQYLNKLLHDVYGRSNPNFLGIVREKMVQLSGAPFYFSDELIDFFEQELREGQLILDKKINSQDIQFMVETLPHQLLGYQKLDLTEEQKADLVREFFLIRKRKEYELAQVLTKRLQETFSVEVDEIETSIIAVLLLSYRKDRDGHLESHDYDDMRLTLDCFIARLELDYRLQFRQRSILLDQLLTHSKALIFRKAYGIISSNPLTEQIKQKYADLFAVTKACVPVLEDAWFIKMNDDDIAYVTIHIGGELANHSEKPSAPVKLMLVCDEGIGVRKLFMQECQKYLPQSQIEAVLSTEQFTSVADILEVDLVISTNQTLETNRPTLFVNAILTDDDVIKLIRFARQHVQSSSQDFSQKLEEYIRFYVKNERESTLLKTQIERLISQELLLDVTDHSPEENSTHSL